jgi:hypothetical protein
VRGGEGGGEGRRGAQKLAPGKVPAGKAPVGAEGRGGGGVVKSQGGHKASGKHTGHSASLSFSLSLSLSHTHTLAMKHMVFALALVGVFCTPEGNLGVSGFRSTFAPRTHRP